MQRQWPVRRQVLPRTDGQRRGDRAYQLSWRNGRRRVRPPRAHPVESVPGQIRTRRQSLRVAVDVRVSTPRQAQQQTAEQQLERQRAHVAQQAGEWCQADVFRDEGSSGATLRRPGLDRLRDTVAAGAFDLLTAPDRLARNSVHEMVLLEWCCWRNWNVSAARSSSWTGP